MWKHSAPGHCPYPLSGFILFLLVFFSVTVFTRIFFSLVFPQNVFDVSITNQSFFRIDVWSDEVRSISVGEFPQKRYPRHPTIPHYTRREINDNCSLRPFYCSVLDHKFLNGHSPEHE